MLPVLFPVLPFLPTAFLFLFFFEYPAKETALVDKNNFFLGLPAGLLHFE